MRLCGKYRREDIAEGNLGNIEGEADTATHQNENMEPGERQAIELPAQAMCRWINLLHY